MSCGTTGTQEQPRSLANEARPALLALYRELDQELRQLGPVCQLSGRCCRFREYEHVLFLSQPEAAVLLADAPPASRPVDDGATCPWQDAQNRCTARDARPIGCRVYYCDPSFTESASELSERYLQRLKQLAAQHGWPWNYAPLHDHLRQTIPQEARSIDPALSIDPSPGPAAP
jgi:Fe-S-cluster containining protein